MTKQYTIKLRTKEYRISVDDVEQRDGSKFRAVFCNGKPIFRESDADGFPKTIADALARELA